MPSQIDLSALLNDNVTLDIDPAVVPDVTPVSILTLERVQECYNMDLPVADGCPVCGAFRMRVGDWVCYRCCDICMDELICANEEHERG